MNTEAQLEAYKQSGGLILPKSMPARIEHWVGPELGEEAFFNATPARVDGTTVLIGRVVLEKTLPGRVDKTPFLGVASENGDGYTKRVKRIDLSYWQGELGVINIEDFRLGEVDENGSALAGINVVLKTRDSHPPPLPAIAVIRNLHTPSEIEIEDMFLLKGEEGKNTLVTSKVSDPLITGFYRPDGEKFNHVFARFTLNRETGEKTVTYEYIVDPPKYGRKRMGLTGLPIELHAEPEEESRQLFILHGGRDRSDDEWEYGIGRALRVVDKEGNVKWIAEKDALLLPSRTGRRRIYNKLTVYSTGHITQEHENGAWLVIAVSYNDNTVNKVIYPRDDFIGRPIDPVLART